MTSWHTFFSRTGPRFSQIVYLGFERELRILQVGSPPEHAVLVLFGKGAVDRAKGLASCSGCGPSLHERH